MAKYEHFIAIMVGLTLLFYFSGLLGNTSNSALLDLLLNPEAFENNPLWQNTLAIFSGIALATAVIVGFFTGVNTKAVAVSVFIISFGSLMWDFMSVVSKVMESNPVIGILLFSVFFVLYAIAGINWWGSVSS